MENKVSITALKGSNYATWKVQIKMLLIKEDLYGFIDGTLSEPADAAAATKFKIRKDKALATIVLSIDPKLLYIIGDPTEPKTVWDKLQSTFQRKTWANKLSLRRRMYSMKLSDGGSLQDHLKSFIEIFDELAVVGDALSEEDKVINLLASLPESFSTLVTAFETLETAPIFEVITERLLHTDNKLKMKLEVQTAMVSTSTKKTFGKKVSCYECGKIGHIRKNCYIFIRKNKNKENANVVNQSENITLVATALNVSSETDSTDWVVDSGATQHMCNKESNFF